MYQFKDFGDYQLVYYNYFSHEFFYEFCTGTRHVRRIHACTPACPAYEMRKTCC